MYSCYSLEISKQPPPPQFLEEHQLEIYLLQASAKLKTTGRDADTITCGKIPANPHRYPPVGVGMQFVQKKTGRYPAGEGYIMKKYHVAGSS
jgi:hypothetical protein